MDDVVDIPELQRRGIIKKVAGAQPRESDYFDYTKSNSPTTETSSSNSNPFDFLDSLAGSNSPAPSPPQPSSSPTDITDINVKLEDFEYKLDRFLERISEVETKLKDFEAKVS